MSEYTPTTEDVAHAIGDWAYREGHPGNQNRPEMLVDDGQTMLDRWLQSERARAWDEGHRAHPYFGVNPYRAKEDA